MPAKPGNTRIHSALRCIAHRRTVRNWDAAWRIENAGVSCEHMLKIGDTAPEFALPSQNGDLVTLSAFRGRQNVVLYFYPKDNTPVCTREACAFRDSYEKFASRDTAVLGVSGDSAQSHAAFAARYRVNFPLLSDSDGALRRAYGVTRTLGVLPGRVTFVIDKQGVVREIFSALFQAEKHVEAALRALG